MLKSLQNRNILNPNYIRTAMTIDPDLLSSDNRGQSLSGLRGVQLKHTMHIARVLWDGHEQVPGHQQLLQPMFHLIPFFNIVDVILNHFLDCNTFSEADCAISNACTLSPDASNCIACVMPFQI